MAFRGWPVEAVEFLEGLEADNSKAYWAAHKDVYERCLRAPTAALLEDLEPEFGEGRIFRPYRDVRFSRDKAPYRTNIAATFSAGGYVSLSAHALGVGSGMYMMAPEQTARYRAAVAEDGAGQGLERIIAALARKGIRTSGHDVLKTAPRGYPRDHPRIELLRNKDLVSWREWPVGPWLGTGEAKRRIAAFFRATAPLNAWLAEHVGGPATPH